MRGPSPLSAVIFAVLGAVLLVSALVLATLGSFGFIAVASVGMFFVAAALIRRTNAELLADAPASRVADCLAREVARVATASGVRIGEDEAVKQWRAMAALTGANRSSMLQDVEAGRPTEIDAISGAVAREGERRGVAAPLNQAMTLLVASLAPR